MPITYESVMPLAPDRYNVDFFNSVLEVERYWGQREVFDGWISYGRVTFDHSLDDESKKRLGFFDAGDALSDRKLDKRVAKIARKVEHKVGTPFKRVFNDLRPIMATSESVRSLSNRRIVYCACCGYMQVPY